MKAFSLMVDSWVVLSCDTSVMGLCLIWCVETSRSEL